MHDHSAIKTQTNPRGSSPSVWQLRDPSSNETPSAFIDLRKPPPPPPLTAATTATMSNNVGAPIAVISTNASRTTTNPTAPLKITAPLVSLVCHPAPPPPPKRSPQTVLTG
ncbi:unnamed protein product [Rodentolepis nana]|uniref:Uncharacterized protein n=1 Tax=Rodentolepis nana TaxID=102285 RepID=A0A0R3TAA9_RODNA|nr:unnamed protein product [Rodentolepis nana]